MSSTLVRAAFALLIVATLGAFVVTQQLKDEFPLVLRFTAAPKSFSPNGDAFRDRVTVGFDLTEPAEVSFSIVDSEGTEVRRLVDDRRLPGDVRHRYPWDGRDDEGRRVPDGVYRMRLVRRDQGRVLNPTGKINLDTRPPRVRIVSARPSVIAPGDAGQRPRVRIRYAGPRNGGPEFRVFRTDVGRPRVVLRFRGDQRKGATWYGRLRDGRPAPDGDYAFTARIRDSAGNVTVAPADVPNARVARPGTGVAVRHLTLHGPLSVVAAGSVATLRVGPYERSFDYALVRAGSSRRVRRGERRGGRFRVRIPRRARTGVYVVRVRAGRRSAVWPLAVAGLPGGRRAAERPRPLVVLPAISWLGLARVDDDLDGFADTLLDSRSVLLDRPFRGGALPPRFRSEVLPLLRFLDRRRLPYDLTTDLALARRRGPALGNAPGVVLAGSALWATGELGRRLRSYVEEGGRLASFGADSLHRQVGLGRRALTGPTPRRPADALGERTALLRTSQAPLAVEQDRVGLFRGLDRFVGGFTVFERSAGLPPGARLLAGAGRDPGQPAFVAYRLGRGIAFRTGTPQWSRELSEGSLGVEVPRVTQRLWALLGRGGR